MKFKSISAILLTIGVSYIYSWGLATQFHKQSFIWWHSLIFFSCLFICLNLLYFVKTDVKTFTGILLSAGVIKFILSLVMVLIYTFAFKPVFFNFFLHFIGHYILFTIFEIRYLLQLIKTKQHEN